MGQVRKLNADESVPYT